MRHVLLATVIVVLAATGDASARRTAHCCLTVPNPDGTTRPYCFVIRVHPGEIGARRVCRLIGGRPGRGSVR